MSTLDPFKFYPSSNASLDFCKPTIPKGSLNSRLHVKLKYSSLMSFVKRRVSLFISPCDPLFIFLDHIPPLSYLWMPIIELLTHKFEYSFYRPWTSWKSINQSWTSHLDPNHHWLIIFDHVNWFCTITNIHINLCTSCCIAVHFPFVKY
jgi:hypothetical protein